MRSIFVQTIVFAILASIGAACAAPIAIATTRVDLVVHASPLLNNTYKEVKSEFTEVFRQELERSAPYYDWRVADVPSGPYVFCDLNAAWQGVAATVKLFVRDGSDHYDEISVSDKAQILTSTELEQVGKNPTVADFARFARQKIAMIVSDAIARFHEPIARSFDQRANGISIPVPHKVLAGAVRVEATAMWPGYTPATVPDKYYLNPCLEIRPPDEWKGAATCGVLDQSQKPVSERTLKRLRSRARAEDRVYVTPGQIQAGTKAGSQ